MPKIIGEVTENGYRRIAVRFEQPDGSGVEDFVDLPAVDLLGKSEAQVEAMVRKGLAQLQAKHVSIAPAIPEPRPDALGNVLRKMEREQSDST
jgi:hypothetical protein